MHNDYVVSGELKNTGDPKYTKWLYLGCYNDYYNLSIIYNVHLQKDYD